MPKAKLNPPYIKVKSITHLKKLCTIFGQDFVLVLNHGARSSKFIQYIDTKKKFYIWHLIDDNTEYISGRKLQGTNIGYAIRHGSFFQEL